MAKRLCALLLFLCAIFLGPITAFCATYTDSMETAAPDDVKTYQNLSPLAYQGSGSWKGLYDKSFLSFSNASQPVGKAVYKVKGCEQVTVGIYTQLGSFVHRTGEGLLLGFGSDKGDQGQRPGSAEQALYSPSRQTAYTRQGGGLLQAVYDNYYLFTDPAALGFGDGTPSDLINYGVNVYASPGAEYSRLTLRHQFLNYTSGSNYCYEEFTASVPAGTVSILVEINDFQRYYDAFSLSWELRLEQFMTSLASVTLTGGSLELGSPKPPPASTEDSGPSSSSDGSGGSSQEAVSKKTTSKKTATDEEEVAADVNAPAAKFEGVIIAGGGSSPKASTTPPASSAQSKPGTASSKSTPSRASSKTSSTSPASSASSSKAMASNEEDVVVTPVSELVYYQSPGGGKSDNAFTTGVVLYIVGVCCVILFILLRSRKK